MIINSSAVGMSSSRKYDSILQAKTASLVTTTEEAEKLNLSENSGKDAITQLQEAEKAIETQKKQKQNANLAATIKNMAAANKAAAENMSASISTQDDFKSHIISLMLKALEKIAKGHYRKLGVTEGISTLKGLSGMKAAYQRSESHMASSTLSILVGGGNTVNIGNGGGSGGSAQGVPAGLTTWKKTTASSVFFAETEVTQYSASGIVKTADGREINFGVDIEMSRGFSAHYESFTQEEYICTDPLVINVDKNFAGVTDQKFLFDLDSDGKEEEISFADNGSGFLALDKNGDGKINDGSELFGAKSGDGFKDLAAYDSDGNGWIDEADDVFSKLKIWTKDENGKDKLISIKDAGVGALYLGSTETEFSLKDSETNATNGVIRKTGVYLKENGEVGTLQHVDLAT